MPEGVEVLPSRFVFEQSTWCDGLAQKWGMILANYPRVHHKHQPLHDKINPKDCQVLSLGDSGFLQFFRVVSSDYGKPRTLLVTNISPPKALLKMIFLLPRWDMLLPWRVKDER